MSSDPAFPVLYAAVALGSTVLADLLLPSSSYSSASAASSASDSDDIPSLAARCLAAAPSYHRLYTHTAGGRIHAFLMVYPFVFFAIAEDSLPRSQALLFLHRLRDASSSLDVPDPPAPRCLQTEFLPVMRDLVMSFVVEERLSRPASPEARGNQESRKKKKNTMIMVADDGNGDEDDACAGVGRRKHATRVWRRQVRVVLTVDLVVCSLLFGIWLLVCRGFQCMAT